MSMTISSTCYPPIWRNCPRSYPNITCSAPFCLRSRSANQTLRFRYSTTEVFTQRFGFSGAKLQFFVRAENGGLGGCRERKSRGKEEEVKELEEPRGKSTTPDRFRDFTKEAPCPPLRWPGLVALGFLIYAWRSVLWELSNWQKLSIGIFHFIGYILKLVLALIFHFIGHPVSHTVLYIETTLHAIHSFYSSIVTSAPIPELTMIIMLAFTILAIGESASPDAINCQPYLLTAAGIIGFGAVRGVIIELLFWLMLFGLFSFGLLFKKRDSVSSVLPVATVLASIGEPWVRVLTIISFSVLAICHHSRELAGGKEEAEVIPFSGDVPFPLLAVALAIGFHVAAKWAGYRHLTWMIV